MAEREAFGLDLYKDITQPTSHAEGSGDEPGIEPRAGLGDETMKSIADTMSAKASQSPRRKAKAFSASLQRLKIDLTWSIQA